MKSNFSEDVSQCIAYGREFASKFYSREVTPNHILLGLLRQDAPIVSKVLNHFGLDRVEILQDNIMAFTDAKVTADREINPDDLPLSQDTNNLLQQAVIETGCGDSAKVGPEHILLAMLEMTRTHQLTFSFSWGEMTHDNVKSYMDQKQHDTDYNEENSLLGGLDEFVEEEMNKKSNSLFEEEDDDEPLDFLEPAHANNGNGASNGRRTSSQSAKSKTPYLDHFSTDLTQAAKEDKLDPVVGREKEIKRVMEILGRRKKNNPILIGEPGVGKSAIVEGLAQQIASEEVSPILYEKRLVCLDMAGMVAGTKYRGQFEERIKGVIDELEANPDIIIFIDEIHTIIGAGGASGSMDAANILKPALARGTIQCIGATTLDEYRNSIEKDGALERRFQKVLVEPTSPEETLEILSNIKDRYEEHHMVRYTDEALEACVKMTDRYITDRCFPDKAIDVLDEVGSRTRLEHYTVPNCIIEAQAEVNDIIAKKQKAVVSQNFELAASCRDMQTKLEAKLDELITQWEHGDGTERIEVDEEMVAQVVGALTGIPVQRIAEKEGVRLKKMGATLKSKVIGQDNAITKMVKAIQRNRVGLKAPNHPIGAFMFLGPTGVGKTYLAKMLAKEMFGAEDALIRVDMSEFSEEFNASRLVGAPPGYVRYEQGGQLTEKVRRKPYSIVLLDEIEKANGKIFNLLLQVLDEGRLTDGNGRLIDFRNTVIIMTSNAGTRQLKDFGKGVGFNAGSLSATQLNDKDKEYARSIIMKSLSKQFSPEFLNRIDEIIMFDQLDLTAIKQIIDLELKSLFGRVKELGYDIDISDAAKEFVAKKGYDILYGARPLKRAIQTYIEDGVCELLLDGEIPQGTCIHIDKAADKEELTFTNN